LKQELNKFAIKCDDVWVVPKVVQSRRRKTVSLEVKHGELTIRTPVGTPDQWIQQFIGQRRAWIEEHMTAQLTRQKNYLINPYETRCVPLKGRDVPLTIRHSAEGSSEKSGVVFCEESVEINLNRRISRSPECVTDTLLQAWLKEQAKEYLIPRTWELSNIVGLRPDQVDIGNYKTMWGRCSAKGDIALNWRLMMAVPEAIDYVIIHELCHLQEFNHSAAFWRKVAQYCSDTPRWRHYFKERSVWLQWR
jgi:hypothetical protein